MLLFYVCELYDLAGNFDYEFVPSFVTIPAGKTHIKFNVSITDDDILEGHETFRLVIISGSLPDGFKRGKLSKVTITIVDDVNGKFYWKF